MTRDIPFLRRARSSLLLLGFILIPAPASAWDAATHRWIAQDAWLRLTPATRNQVAILMKAHPDFSEIGAPQQPAGDPDIARFADLAVWPDRIRDDPRHAERTHRDWHYINYPLGPGALRAPTPPAGQLPHALSETARIFADPAAPHADRAIALAWFAHLVGDAHQPLHVASWFDAAGEGDRGGNRVLVQVPEPRASAQRLHALWDSLATPLPPPGSEAKIPGIHDTFDTWIRGSLALAAQVAYPRPVRFDGPPIVLSSAFLDAARAHAVQQVQRAGQRLATALNTRFDRTQPR